VLLEGTGARLLRGPILSVLLGAARELAHDRVVCGTAAAALLGNLTHLVMGTAGRRPAGDAPSLLRLPASPHLVERRGAAAWCGAVMALLPAAAAASKGPKTMALSTPEAALVARQLACLGAQAPLLQLLGVLGDGRDMPLFAGLCLHLLQDLPAAETLVERGAATAPPAAAAADPQQAADTGSGASAALNALAFAPQVLPALWRWLSLDLGLPLEAPLAARLGLDVEAVAGGCRRLAGQHTLVLGVFCRCGVLVGGVAVVLLSDPWSAGKLPKGSVKSCELTQTAWAP
jgi:hypothetical protein